MARRSLFILITALLALVASAKHRPHGPGPHGKTTPAPCAAHGDDEVVYGVNAPFPPCKLKMPSRAEIQKLPKPELRSPNRRVKLIPANYDLRTMYPNCQTLNSIRDQGQCGTCWAVNSAGLLSDRMCIASGQNTVNRYISANQVASCIPYYETTLGRTPLQNCNDGGDPALVFDHAVSTGFETGGDFGSNVGCVPYPVNPATVGPTPLSCVTTSCPNSGYGTALAADKRMATSYFADYGNYAPGPLPNPTTNMNISQRSTAVYNMQVEIMERGPIAAVYDVWSDFQAWGVGWTSAREPYNGHGPTATYQGGHVLKLIGWRKELINGVNVSYWLGANTWGAAWGDSGVAHVRMRNNVEGMEAAWTYPVTDVKL